MTQSKVFVSIHPDYAPSGSAGKRLILRMPRPANANAGAAPSGSQVVLDEVVPLLNGVEAEETGLDLVPGPSGAGTLDTNGVVNGPDGLPVEDDGDSDDDWEPELRCEFTFPAPTIYRFLHLYSCCVYRL